MKQEYNDNTSSDNNQHVDDEKLSFGQDEGQNNGSDDNMTDECPENDEFEKLQAKYDELNNNYLRLHAEFDNFRKRTMKEKADLIKSGGERVLTEVITLVDDFERALGSIHSATDKDAMLEGLDLIYGKFVGFLAQQGVKEIETIGRTFDPEKFEAVTTVLVQDPSQSGKVIDCIQKGYSLNDKIIRFPKVIVGE